MSAPDPVAAPIPKPILQVHDMTAAAAFYDRLGFDVDRFDFGCSIVGYSGHELFHLQIAHQLDQHSNPTSMYLIVSDLSQWHTKWQDAGVTVGEIADLVGGMREFSCTDPSGNTLRVGQSVGQR